jgi:glutathione peroxidase
MRKIYLVVAFLLLVGIIACNSAANPTQVNEKKTMNEKSVLDFTVKGIDGQEMKLDAYKGKVLLIVNVASRCGYTPQYDGLQAIYKKYQEKGFEVLGFPANNFGGQEPGTNEEIKTFCQTKFDVSFPLFAKISVKGADIHPLYQHLTNKAGDVTWNFNKFLIGKNGEIIQHFESSDSPDGEVVISAIEKALK